MATVKENLISAKALIDAPEKWIKGDYHTSDCYCALGAVARATGLEISPVRLALSEEARAISNQVPSPFHSVWRYNDDPNTSHADIMALFQRAIDAQD